MLFIVAPTRLVVSARAVASDNRRDVGRHSVTSRTILDKESAMRTIHIVSVMGASAIATGLLIGCGGYGGNGMSYNMGSPCRP